MKTAAVVVHFGPRSATDRALRALAETAPEAAVTVVDNAGDLRREELPAGVRLLCPGRNLGYGAACNLAAKGAAADFLLFLNNDVELLPGALPALEAVLGSPGAAAAVPRLLDSAGRPVPSIFRPPAPRRVLFEALFLPRLLPGIPFFHGHHTVLTAHDRLRDVETASGAAILVRRGAFERIGGFDEDFFFYAEESDLFARLRQAGGRVVFEPAARAVHHGGLASAAVPQAELDRRLHAGLCLYARKHHGARGERATARALRLGARLRLWIAHLQPGQRGRERRRRYADILRLPRSG
ncbi:MAG TPA: glycosyltransferase family 2 protein [Thermoanaerobaculia bacterium]|nr:glycosyltransferase family 2 protein [Thermoanaerobaculia bacterium]